MFFWKVIEMFVDKETKSKLIFSKEGGPQALKDLFHPSQLEERYGGTAKTPTRYWPPIMPSGIFRDPNENDPNMMSEE